MTQGFWKEETIPKVPAPPLNGFSAPSNIRTRLHMVKENETWALGVLVQLGDNQHCLSAPAKSEKPRGRKEEVILRMSAFGHDLPCR